MSLATNVSDLATRIATEFKLIKTYISGSGTGDVSGLDTTATNLVDAINEVNAASGGPIDLDDLTDVVITAAATGDVLRFNGTNWVDVTEISLVQGVMASSGIDHLGDVTVDTPVDRDIFRFDYSLGEWVNVSEGVAAQDLASAIFLGDLSDVDTAGATDGQALVYDLGSGDWLPGDVSPTVPDASDTVKGIVELATNAETVTGTDTVRATTPAGVDAALDARVVDASATVKGIVELATDAETTTGTDTVRATTPANVKAAIDARTATSSAAGIVELATDAEAITGTDTARATTPANVRAAIDDRVAAVNALIYKGVIDASSNPNYPAANAGDMYIISVAGKIGGASGPNVEVGDMLICKTDSTAAGNEATVGAQWNIVQRNLDGAVIGPASATDNGFVTYDGTTGKLIKSTGYTFDSDGTLAANSATRIPAQSAVKTYADTKQPLDTDLTAIAALTSAANKGLQSTGAGTWALYDLTAAGKALLDDADASAQLTTLGVSTFIKTLLDDADAATARATLSVYSQAEIGDPTTNFVTTFEAGLT